MREVKLATLEVDGVVSVIKQDWAQTVQKSDVDGKQRQKEKGGNEGEEIPAEKNTATPSALGKES